MQDYNKNKQTGRSDQKKFQEFANPRLDQAEFHVLPLMQLWCIVQQLRVGSDFINVHQMSWRVMAAGAHAATKPNGSIKPLCPTKARTQGIQYLLAKIKIVH